MIAQDDRIVRLKEIGAATIYEAQGQKGAVDPTIKPLDPEMTLAGRAVTLRLKPADNWYVHLALLEAGPGDVLVIDTCGYTQAGPWGDILTLAAQKRGLVGLVTDGAVRDSRAIIDSGFPVFARGLCIKGTTKVQQGEIGVDIVVGGVTVRQNDILVGDADGLVVIREDEIDIALREAELREEHENNMRLRIREGASTLELLGLPQP